MKSLEITNNQKLMILEMAKKLFPEFDILFNQVGFEDYVFFDIKDEQSDNLFRIIDSNHPIQKEECRIHWFEFCMVHLPERFYPKYDTFINGTGADFSEDHFAECIIRKLEHPVEYIYKQFKNMYSK